MKLELIQGISNRLYELFFLNKNIYGIQLDDGRYKLLREKIFPTTIDNMIKKNESFLVYQEQPTHTQVLLKWICLDIDISKRELDVNSINDENSRALKESAKSICSIISSLDMPYMLEFSGRRGFHIWILFDELVTKENGFILCSYILSRVNLPKGINVDKFPKAATVGKNSKGIGSGVKLPLSTNKSSNRRSFFFVLHDLETLDFKKDTDSDNFFEIQYEILRDYVLTSNEKLLPVLNKISAEITLKNIPTKKYLNDSTFKNLEQNISLDTILLKLRDCETLKEILHDFENGLSGYQRSLLVGLFGRIRTKNDPDFGYNLLYELFSRVKGFNKEITVKKLQLLRYYFPLSCNCKVCKEKGVRSPIELVDGIKLERVQNFRITELDRTLFDKICEAEINYSDINDEVALYPQLMQLSNSDFLEINMFIRKVFKGEQVKFDSGFEFKRLEEGKVRTLYNLSYLQKMVSTYFIFLINNIFYIGISDSSFGYRFSPGFFNNNIFYPWYGKWVQFAKKIEDIVYNSTAAFDEYYIIKADVKNFYESINLTRLKVKLFEEAPISVKNSLSDLSDGEIATYKRILDYLIDLSKYTTQKNSGVPQGPAYARYLAELYLLNLDQIIEPTLIKNREFYFRFVDDIFIFVADEENARDIFSRLKNWMSINDLELNYDKTEFDSVKNYRESGHLKKYKDDIKYIVDYTSRNKAVLSDADYLEAMSLLNELSDESKFGLKDDLRFFYFHSSNEPRLNGVKKKLNKIIPFSKNGRGSLYQNFYKDLFEKFNADFWNLSKDIGKIKGLSLTHFLNTILSLTKSISDKEFEVRHILVELIEREDLTPADKLLNLILASKIKYSPMEPLLESTPEDVIKMALEVPDNYCGMEYKSHLIDRFQNLKGAEEFIADVYKLIMGSSLAPTLTQDLSNYFFIRISEWEIQGINKTFLLDENNLILLYNCLSFFTLFYEGEKDTAIIPSWQFLLRGSEEVKIKNTLIELRWLNRIEIYKKNDFKPGGYMLLLSTTEGSELNKFHCQNGLLEKYKDVLWILLLSKEIDISSLKNDIKDKEKETLFMKWLSDTNVSLYPKTDNLCIKNIALNGLIVLKNQNLIFIKDIHLKINFENFDYIIFRNPSKNGEVEYEISIDKRLDTLMLCDNLVGSIIKLTNIIEQHKKFKEKYGVNLPVFFEPPYADEFYRPYVPFYSVDSKRLSIDGSVKANDINSYWDNLFGLYKNTSEIQLVNGNNPLNFSNKNFGEKFFPSNNFIKNDTSERINFLEQFALLAKKYPILSVFDYHFVWSQSILSYLTKLNNQESRVSPFLQLIKIRLSEFTDHDDIFFSVNEHISIDDTNLKVFFKTIKDSISIFQASVKFQDFNFDNQFELEIQDLSLVIDQTALKFPLEHFKKEAIDFRSMHFASPNKNILVLYIGSELLEPNDEILLYNYLSKEFETIPKEDLQILTKNKTVFIHSINEEDKIIYRMVIPDNEFAKAFERIRKRKEFFLQLLAHDPTNPHLELFPVKLNTKDAFEIYNDFEYKARLKELLKYHFETEKDIDTRIIGWLSLFNQTSLEGSKLKKYLDDNNYTISKLYKSILSVLNNHVAINEQDVLFFKRELESYYLKQNTILFPIKDPYRDNNGLLRLLNRCGFPGRHFNFDNQVEKIFGEAHENLSIVIPSDIIISGSQIMRALDYYLEEIKDNSELASRNKKYKNERYYKFQNLDQANIFQSNFLKAREIIFLTPLLTESFKVKISEKFKDYNIVFSYSLIINERRYLFKTLQMDVPLKKVFIELIRDDALLKKIFLFNESEDNVSIEDIEDRNLLLRVGSLPAKHLKIFSLQPQHGYPPLLEYVKNWQLKI